MAYDVLMPLWLAIALWAAIIALLWLVVRLIMHRRQFRKDLKRQIGGLKAAVDSVDRLNRGR